jgi:hypothetical protein
MYDLGGALAAGVNAQPVRTWSEHQGIITCLAPVPGMPHLFASGARGRWGTRGPRAWRGGGRSCGRGQRSPQAPLTQCWVVVGLPPKRVCGRVPTPVNPNPTPGSRDMTIKLWDTRMENSAAALVANAASGSAAAHGDMVRRQARARGQRRCQGANAWHGSPQQRRWSAIHGAKARAHACLGARPSYAAAACTCSSTQGPACPTAPRQPHPNAPLPTPRRRRHQVSCIDVASGEPLLVSTSMDRTVSAWDLRRMGSTPLVTPVMTVQVRGREGMGGEGAAGALPSRLLPPACACRWAGCLPGGCPCGRAHVAFLSPCFGASQRPAAHEPPRACAHPRPPPLARRAPTPAPTPSPPCPPTAAGPSRWMAPRCSRSRWVTRPCATWPLSRRSTASMR